MLAMPPVVVQTCKRARSRNNLASTLGNSSSLKIGLEPTELSPRVRWCNQSQMVTRFCSSNGIAPTPYIYKNLGYDIFTDLMPIATIGILDGLFMLVDAKSPYQTLQQFIDHAKKDHAVYGSPGVGNGLHLAAEIFSKKAGIKMQHIPYKGASEVMTGMLSGSVEVMFVTPPSVMGLIAEGRVRALAFTGSKPFPAFPDVPLLKDILPGFEPIGSWGMFFAAAKTPPEIAEKVEFSGPRGHRGASRGVHHATRRLRSGQSKCRPKPRRISIGKLN